MDIEIKGVSDVVAIFRRRKRGSIIAFTVVMVIAVMLVVFIPPQYRSSSTILIEEQEVPRDYVTSTVTSYAEQRLQTINQRIMSTPKLLEIINRFNLYADLRKKKTTEEIVDRMRKKDIKLDTISVDVIDPRTGRPSPATIAFSLSFTGKNASAVQQVANTLASLFLEENLREREQVTQGTSQFMQDEMANVKAQLAAVEANIAGFKRRNINTLPELAQLNYQEMDRVDRDIDQMNAQLRSLKEREGYLQTQLAAIPTDASSQDKTRLSELRVQLSNLLSRVSENYPDVRKIRSEIATVEKRLKAAGQDGLATKPDSSAYITLSSELASVKNEIDSVKSQIAGLEKKRGVYSSRIQVSPRVEEEYKSLAVERNNLQGKFDELSKKYMEARVAHGLEKVQKGERFTIIEAAMLPEKPFSPNALAILLVGLVVGIGGGVALAFIQEYSDHSVRSSDMLAKLTGFNVLAAIPEINTPGDMLRARRINRNKAAGAVITVVTGVLIFHFFIMDLDVFWAKLLRRLNV